MVYLRQSLRLGLEGRVVTKELVLTIGTALLVERVIHARVVQVLVGVVRLVALEGTERTEGSSDNHCENDSSNSSSRETDGEDLWREREISECRVKDYKRS